MDHIEIHSRPNILHAPEFFAHPHRVPIFQSITMKLFDKLHNKYLQKVKKFYGYKILPRRVIQKNLLGGGANLSPNQNRVKLYKLTGLEAFSHLPSFSRVGICFGKRSQNMNLIASVTKKSFVFDQDDMIKD